MSKEQQQRLNITSKVTGRIEEGDFVLYHYQSPIGKINLNTKELELYDGYAMEENRIYALEDNRVFHDYYAHGCDLGWCP
ncbi:DUF2553 family protein [Paenactinomyces guangxiensis]|uniref:DUF2553 family protein n=1 Tax=Paenactinomyces guangxiensis TaxID=1490290 RepID=A0A7W2A943_9BACL|nr:DUF2553 family protein [Paenactinomyces guangxiensis]MBA4494839.1 DUF2553 family protein [Paenactinomyces guangxiensis]MBH8591922.1 DUF2553 family protein [Paenactinomyces guangxiensis]